MFEAVQVRERQAVDLPSGSTVITEQMVTEQMVTEQMVTEPAAPHGGLRLPGPKAAFPRPPPSGRPVGRCALVISRLRRSWSDGARTRNGVRGSPERSRPSPYR